MVSSLYKSSFWSGQSRKDLNFFEIVFESHCPTFPSKPPYHWLGYFSHKILIAYLLLLKTLLGYPNKSVGPFFYTRMFIEMHKSTKANLPLLLHMCLQHSL